MKMEGQGVIYPNGGELMSHRQQLREAFGGDFYCPWVWSEKSSAMGCSSSDLNVNHHNQLENETPFDSIAVANPEKIGVGDPGVTSQVKEDSSSTAEDMKEKTDESDLRETATELDQRVDNENANPIQRENETFFDSTATACPEKIGVGDPGMTPELSEDSTSTSEDMKKEKTDEIDLGKTDSERDQPTEIEDLAPLDVIREKISQALSADSSSMSYGHDHQTGAEEVFKSLKLDGSTNTSQPELIDAHTGNSQQAELIDCATGSSQPFMIECGIQTSQSLLDDLKKELRDPVKAPIIFPRLTLQTNPAVMPPKRPRLDYSDDCKISHPIYSKRMPSPSSSSIAFEFEEADKENHSSISCDKELSMENENSNVATPFSSPFFNMSRNPVVRVGLSKKSKSGNRPRYPFNQLSSKNDGKY